MSVIIRKTTFDFLKKLSVNNDRDWFLQHKDQYELAKGNAEDFVDALIAKINQHDDIETPSAKKSLYRIYNDVRFSKDKSPYNPRFAGYLKRRKPTLRGGYYFWIRPVVPGSDVVLHIQTVWICNGSDRTLILIMRIGTSC